MSAEIKILNNYDKKRRTIALYLQNIPDNVYRVTIHGKGWIEEHPIDAEQIKKVHQIKDIDED